MSEDECSCCIYKFTKIRKPVECPKCKFQICSQCFERYTLDNLAIDYIGTSCMSCKEPLSFDFITSHTTKTFVSKKWKDKRKEILIGIETAKLPETQNSANAYKEYRDKIEIINIQIIKLREQLQKIFEVLDLPEYMNSSSSSSSSNSTNDYFIESKVNMLYDKYTEYDRQLFYTNSTETEKRAELEEKCKFFWKAYVEAYELKNEILAQEKDLHRCKLDFGRFESMIKTEDDDNIEVGSKTTERRTFIMPCPLRDCKGFMSSGYKCGLCERRICSKCHTELKEKDEEHICDKNMVESVKAINSETRPCPKCGARIYKLEGCDQMWCLHCKTAFSWDTGKIVQGERIHNPEYFRWMREHNNQIPRVEDQLGCEGLPAYYVFDDLAYEGLCSYQTSTILVNLWRMVHHINDVEIPGKKMLINRDLRVKYLINEIDMEKMRIQLMKRERFNMRNTFIIGMLRLIVDVISDKLRHISREPSMELIDVSIQELVSLCKYVNEQMENFTKVHGLITPRFKETEHQLFETIKRSRNYKNKKPLRTQGNYGDYINYSDEENY